MKLEHSLTQYTKINSKWLKDLNIRHVCVCAKSSQLYLTVCDAMDYIVCQASLSIRFSGQEYWSGLPCPPLNIRHGTIKLLENNIGKTFSDINPTNFFIGRSPKAIEMKAKINKQDLIKLVRFCIVKKTISKMKRPPKDLEKIFSNDVIDKGLISKAYKQLINSITVTTKIHQL